MIPNQRGSEPLRGLRRAALLLAARPGFFADAEAKLRYRPTLWWQHESCTVSYLGCCCALIAGGLIACRSDQQGKRAPASSARQALAMLAAASEKRDYNSIFALLDKQSLWSIESIHAAHRESALLVKRYYPQERQSGPLARVAAALRWKTAKAYFATTLAPSQPALRGIIARQTDSDRQPTANRQRLKTESGSYEFCKAGELWRFCGLRASLEQVKVRAIRDLKSIRENVETYRAR